MIKQTGYNLDYILIDTSDTFYCTECNCVLSKPDYALHYWHQRTGSFYYCSRHAKSAIESLIANLKFQVGELNQLIDRLPKRIKSHPEGNINLGEHL